MFQKMIVLLILLIRGVQPGVQLKMIPSLIPKHSFDTPDGYKIDWKAAINPKEFAKYFESVKLYYNGRPDTDCCYGYDVVTKKPKETGDTEPFLVSLCGNQSTVFVSFKLGRKETVKLQLEDLPPCSSGVDWVFTAGMIGTGVTVFTIIVLIVIIYFLKRNKNKDGDEESTGRSE